MKQKSKNSLGERHIAWIVYHKMGMKIKPSKKVYSRTAFKQSAKSVD